MRIWKNWIFCTWSFGTLDQKGIAADDRYFQVRPGTFSQDRRPWEDNAACTSPFIDSGTAILICGRELVHLHQWDWQTTPVKKTDIPLCILMTHSMKWLSMQSYCRKKQVSISCWDLHKPGRYRLEKSPGTTEWFQHPIVLNGISMPE